VLRWVLVELNLTPIWKTLGLLALVSIAFYVADAVLELGKTYRPGVLIWRSQRGKYRLNE
jgi:hypothetical protein